MFVFARLAIVDVVVVILVELILPLVSPVLAIKTAAEILVEVELDKTLVPDALRPPVERFVTVVFNRVDKPDALSPAVEILVVVALAKTKVPVALIVPVVIPVLAIKTPTETFVAVVLFKVVRPDALIVPVVIPPAVKFCNELVSVLRFTPVIPVLAINVLVDIDELIKFVKVPPPVTIKLLDVIPILAFRIPVEILLAVTFVRFDNPDTFKVPIDILVSTILLEVNDTTVKVPPTVTFPDKFTFDAEIVVADKVPAVIFIPVAFVEDNNPELILVVEIKLLVDILVAVTFCKVLLPDARILPFTSIFVVGEVVFTPKLPFVENIVEFNCENDNDAEVFKTIYIIY
jgi:hypothetical protein